MSMKLCSVVTCSNNSIADSSLSWHRFPKSDELRNKWLRRCGWSGPVKAHHRVCSAHFPPDAFELNFKEKLMGTPSRRYLKPNAVPKLFLKSVSDGYNVETTGNDSRKRTLPATTRPVKESATTERSSGFKVIGKSKRTCKVDGSSSRTEEIVFEVDETGYDDDDDGDGDFPPLKCRKTNGRHPEKGVFESSISLMDDEDDTTLLQNEITIPEKSCPLDSGNLSKPVAKTCRGADCEKIIMTGDAQSPSPSKMSNGCETNRDGESINNHVQKVAETEKSEITRGNFLEPESVDKVNVKSAVHVDSLSVVEKLFSPNQLKSLMKAKKRISWTDDEIFEAVKLRFFSLPMFSYLRNKKGYPFPGKLAISRWAKKMKLRGGVLQGVLKILELGEPCADAKKFGMKDFCVLSLSEMEVKETIEYNETEDEIVGPYKKMQFMMATSLTGSWQQLVFVDFDSDITKDTVMSMIVQLYSIGYYVVCLSSDCSEASVKLCNDLGAGTDSPCFPHPVGDSRIIVIPDAMHCIRALRDVLLDGGFEIEGSVINSVPLHFLLDLGACSKLRPYHLQPNEKEKRRTDVAVQLVSDAIGSALTKLKPGDAAVATSTGKFLKVMSHWFDLMNVGTSVPTVPFRSPYGHDRREQDELLDHVKSVISIMKCVKSSEMQSFQTGIVMSCTGLRLLLDEMNKRFGLENILTRWLNHTALDNLFSVLCSDFSQVPTPVVALSRLQSVLFGENLDSTSEMQSVFTFVIKRARIKLQISKYLHKNAETMYSQLLDTIFSNSEYFSGNKVALPCLLVIAENINSALGNKYPHLRKFPDRSEDHEPSEYFLRHLVKMEEVFFTFTRSLITAECKNIAARLMRSIRGFTNPLPADVVRIFVRLRIEIYARSLVPKLSQISMKRRIHSKLLMALRNNEE